MIDLKKPLPNTLPELLELGLSGRKLAQMLLKPKFDHEDFMQLRMLTQLPHDVVKNLELTDLMLGSDA